MTWKAGGSSGSSRRFALFRVGWWGCKQLAPCATWLTMRVFVGVLMFVWGGAQGGRAQWQRVGACVWAGRGRTRGGGVRVTRHNAMPRTSFIQLGLGV